MWAQVGRDAIAEHVQARMERESAEKEAKRREKLEKPFYTHVRWPPARCLGVRVWRMGLGSWGGPSLPTCNPPLPAEGCRAGLFRVQGVQYGSGAPALPALLHPAPGLQVWGRLRSLGLPVQAHPDLWAALQLPGHGAVPARLCVPARPAVLCAGGCGDRGGHEGPRRLRPVLGPGRLEPGAPCAAAACQHCPRDTRGGLAPTALTHRPAAHGGEPVSGRADGRARCTSMQHCQPGRGPRTADAHAEAQGT